MDADWTQGLSQYDAPPDDAELAITIEWDTGNESELARHQVSPEESEQVIANDPRWFSNKRGRAGNWQVIGRTDAGRVLTLIVLLPTTEQTLRVITGWDASTGERTRYRGR